MQHGMTLNFIGKEGEGSLTSPHASELISFIDEIQKNYVAVFVFLFYMMPYSKMLTSGIDIVHSERTDLFKFYVWGKMIQTHNLFLRILWKWWHREWRIGCATVLVMRTLLCGMRLMHFLCKNYTLIIK